MIWIVRAVLIASRSGRQLNLVWRRNDKQRHSRRKGARRRAYTAGSSTSRRARLGCSTGRHRRATRTASGYPRCVLARFSILKELTPPGPGIGSDNSAKSSREMRLIAHAARQGHLRQGYARRQHKLLSPRYAPLYEVGKRGLSESLAKGAGEMARAQSNETSELTDSDGRVEFVLDVGCQPFGLPRSEAALQ